MHAILMLHATTMTEATLVNATLDMKTSMAMEKLVKTSMSVLLKLINVIRLDKSEFYFSIMTKNRQNSQNVIMTKNLGV